MLLFQLKLQWIGEVKKKRLSEMMNEFRGDKAVKRLAFCERFLWFQTTIGRYSAQKNSVIVYNWFFDVFE